MKKLFFIVLVTSFYLFSIGGTIFFDRWLLFRNSTFIQKNINQEILWSLVQNWRIENNLQPYTKNQTLCTIASTRLNEVQNNWSHNKFLDRFAYKYPSLIGENLAKDWTDEITTFNSWINSPAHLKNLKDSFIYSCLETKDSFAVQIFSSCENGCPNLK